MMKRLAQALLAASLSLSAAPAAALTFTVTGDEGPAVALPNGVMLNGTIEWFGFRRPSFFGPVSIEAGGTTYAYPVALDSSQIVLSESPVPQGQPPRGGGLILNFESPLNTTGEPAAFRWIAAPALFASGSGAWGAAAPVGTTVPMGQGVAQAPATPSPVGGAPKLRTLDGAATDALGPVTGSFILDAETWEFSDVEIFAGGMLFDDSLPFLRDDVVGFKSAQGKALTFAFAGPVWDRPGALDIRALDLRDCVIPLPPLDATECLPQILVEGSALSQDGLTGRLVTSFSSVPAPPAALLLCTALAVAAGLRRRRGDPAAIAARPRPR